MKCRSFFPGALLIVLAGCSAIGVPATSDPREKLQQAIGLLRIDRPLPADTLIREAIDIYQQRGDQDGLAEAYRQYALFLLSPAVTHSDYAFVQYGFTDKTISFKTRYAKSVEYFEKAEALYQSIGGTERASDLSNIYLNKSDAQYLNGQTSEACASLERSRAFNHEFMATHPGADVQVPKEFGSFDNGIDKFKKQIGCI